MHSEPESATREGPGCPGNARGAGNQRAIMSGLPDARLAELARSGSRLAFDILYRRHHAWVAAYLRGFVWSVEDAEDLAQGVFERLFAARERYLPGKSFCGWVRAVARNSAIDYRRKRDGRARAALRSQPLTVEVDERIDPARILETGALRDEVREALRALSAVNRETVLRRYFGAMSLEEVARAMDCPIGTVKSRLNSALGQLGDVLRRGEAKEEER